MPSDVPPRRGTPEFDEWMKKRNEDAAAIKPAGTPEIDKWMKKRAEEAAAIKPSKRSGSGH